MDVVTVLRLEDVNGQPIAKLGGLPASLRVGDPLGLKFKLTRSSNGRSEVLDVHGQFQVTAVGLDASCLPRRQLLSVSALHKPPTWRSVPKSSQRRTMGPAQHPRTPLQ